MAILKKRNTALNDDEPGDTGPRTGPNVDAGLVDGVATVDPQTAAGIAAEAARKANGAKTSETDDGRLEVTDTVFGEVSDNEIKAVQETNPTPPTNPKK